MSRESSRKLFLISNDDGVHAPGLKALVQAVRQVGDVVVVAPHVERSATSQAISISVPLRMEEIEPQVFAVEGTPADCIMLAYRKILHRRPDWVLSGINRGGNLGIDTLYSGTVGAALEGRLHGTRAMAFSCQMVGHGHGPTKKPLRYDVAAQVALQFLSRAEDFELGNQGILNVNIPSVDFSELKGVRGATLGRRIYEQEMHSGIDPRGRPYFWIGGGGESYEDIPDSDCALLDQGFVTVSVLKPELLDDQLTRKLPNAIAAGLGSAIDSLRSR